MDDDFKDDSRESKERLAEKDAEILELRERVAELEQDFAESNDGDDQDDDDNSDGGNQDVSLKEILENPEITKAINTAVSAWANVQPEEMKLRFRSLHLGLLFGFLVLLVIGYLGYAGVLSKDVTGALVAALIGYWYGKQSRN
jgi:hypothetical protein